MLTLLKIHQFALADSLELDIAQGFTVITGETGAGKSIMLDALGLCLGDKADSQAVRHGSDRAELVAMFDVSQQPAAQAWLADRELDADDECSLRRVISREGRSKAWINGQPVTLNEVRALGHLLLNLHSQHAHQQLLDSSSHRQLLDNVAGLSALAQQVRQAWQTWQSAERALADSLRHQAARAERLDWLTSQLEEWLQLGLKAGEYEQLEQEYDRLAHFESLMADGQFALQLLAEGDQPIIKSLQQALKQLEPHAGRASSLQQLCQSLQSALIEVKEGSSELRRFLEQQELDPARQNYLEGKISEAQRLARKHKTPVADLPAWAEELQQERLACEHAQDSESLQAEAEQAAQAYHTVAEQLRQQRVNAAPDLASAIAQHLQALGMPHATLRFAFTPLAKGNADGLDAIELLFSANLGHAPQTLAKVASGGELSRFALAVQVIQAQHSAVPVLVFDEVDVGISGGTAEVVGRLLRQLGEHAQILCITHQPQVASCGHQHWQVEKYTAEGQTFSRVRELNREERIQEIARMSGGLTITPETLKHAEAMLAL